MESTTKCPGCALIRNPVFRGFCAAGTSFPARKCVQLNKKDLSIT